MSVPAAFENVVQCKKMLANLDRWIEKAVAYAQKKSFEPNVFLTLRLAPDQYPLARQVQSACDAAKAGAARLTGKEPPKHPDTEQTIDELRARIRTVLTYLETFRAEDFAQSDERRIALPFMEGKSILGHDYLVELMMPNLYFHITTAYAILRNNGVDVGKMDFLGSINAFDSSTK
jgi:hypothetical protein